MAEVIAKNDIETKEGLLDLIKPNIKRIKLGETITGKVIDFTKDEATVDIGYKTEGVILVGEYLNENFKQFSDENIKKGEKVEAVVIRLQDVHGRVILSKKQAQERHVWEKIEEAQKTKSPISAQVVKVVNGGLIVDIDGTSGFLPYPLINLRHGQNVDVEELLGKEINVRIIYIDRKIKNVVVSRKDVLLEENKETREKVIKELEVGQIRKGTVAAFAEFGAFIDLGGIDGLVHISEISWKPIEKAEDVLKIGQEVTVQVTEIQSENTKVALSIRAIEPDPWPDFAKEFAIGQIIKATVKKIVDHGVLFEVNDFVQGRVDFSELFEQRVPDVGNVVSVGSVIFIKIMDIDLVRHKIVLSVREATSSVNLDSDDFDPEVYGMHAEHNEDGSYKYPEGFNPKKGTWEKGFEKEKKEWEKEYSNAEALYNEHKKFITEWNEKIYKAIKESKTRESS